jgi:hypothetical protein
VSHAANYIWRILTRSLIVMSFILTGLMPSFALVTQANKVPPCNLGQVPPPSKVDPSPAGERALSATLIVTVRRTWSPTMASAPFRCLAEETGLDYPTLTDAGEET